LLNQINVLLDQTVDNDQENEDDGQGCSSEHLEEQGDNAMANVETSEFENSE
jgi:hypothetical protein